MLPIIGGSWNERRFFLVQYQVPWNVAKELSNVTSFLLMINFFFQLTCSSLNLEWLANSDHVIQSSCHMFDTCLFLVYNLKFTPNHTPLKYRCLFKTKHQIEHIYLDLQIQIVQVAICLLNFGAHLSILIIIKVNILVLVEWSHKYPLPNDVNY